MHLGCQNVSVQWPGESAPTLDNVSVAVDSGEFVAIVGPSGCGKSTLLNILSGLRTADSGQVFVDGVVTLGPAPGVGMIFQDHSLFPWLTVAANVEFGLRFAATTPASRRQAVKSVLDRVGLSSSAAKYPHQLSGGMRQRVAIARSLAQNLSVILMDEPFAALDFQTRLLMQRFLLEVWIDYRPGIVFVTHYMDEAIMLADRILLMSVNPGIIVEDLAVTLTRPRDPTGREFNEYRAHLTRHLEAEAVKVFQSSLGVSNVR